MKQRKTEQNETKRSETIEAKQKSKTKRNTESKRPTHTVVCFSPRCISSGGNYIHFMKQQPKYFVHRAAKKINAKSRSAPTHDTHTEIDPNRAAIRNNTLRFPHRY